MNKKILAFLLAALMVTSFGALIVSAADPVQTGITFSVDQLTVEDNATTATVGIWMTNLTDEDDLGTIDLKVEYDQSVLKQTDVYAETGSGRNKVYYGAACFEGGYQFSEPGGTANPLTFIAWTTAKTNPCYDSAYEMNTYEFAFIDFEIIDDTWEGRTPLTLSIATLINRPDDADMVGYTLVDGWIQRGEYVPPVEDANTVTFKDGNTGKVLGTKDFPLNEEATLTAQDMPAAPSLLGYTFDKWITLTTKEGNPYYVDAVGFTFNGDIEVIAHWVKDTSTLHGLTVNNGNSTKTYQRSFAAIATVTAYGENFSYWMDAEGTVVSLDASYKFRMPNKGVTLTAVYNATAPEAALAIVENTLENGEIYTFISRDLADGAELVESGILYTRKATEADLTVDTTVNTVTRGVSTADASESVYAFQKNVEGKAGTWLVRGYTTYTIGGTTKTVYTAVSSIVVA